MNPTRREFLAGTAAAGLAPYLPSLPAQKAEPFSFVFMSDTHAGLKANLVQNEAMLAEIGAVKPDFVVNGGDVTDYGWSGEYANYRALIRPHETAGVPFHHVAGNHDVRWSPLGPKAYREGTGDPMYTSFDHQGCHFVLLDSTVPLSHYGHYEAKMLRWLERDLAKAGPKTPVFVFTHHWIGREGIMIDNEVRLLEILKPYNVIHVFNGHGHSDLLWHWDGIANTMNKGLYQGSWMRVDVDPIAGTATIARRAGEPTNGAAKPESLWTGSLKNERSEILSPARARLHRIDNGPWIEGAPVLAATIPGSHRITLKRGTSYARGQSFEVPADGKTTVLASRKLKGGVMSHLRLDDDRVLVSQMGGSILCADATTLNPIWEATTGDYCHSSPEVCGDLVVVGSADGKVYAFDRKSGKARWTFATGGPVYASATYVKDTIVIGSGDGQIYGLTPRGKRKWAFRLPPGNTAFVQSPAVTDGERVFVGAWDKAVYCLDPVTGAQLWRQECTDGKSFAYSPAIGNPVAAEGKFFVPANANLLWAFDAVSGEPLWKTASPGDKFGYSSPIYEGGRLYTGTLGDKGEVRCVDAKTGEILWTCATGNGIYDSGPALGNGWIVIGSVSGALNIIDKADGKLRAQRQLPTGHFLSTPVARGNEVWAATFGDELFRISVA